MVVGPSHEIASSVLLDTGAPVTVSAWLWLWRSHASEDPQSTALIFTDTTVDPGNGPEGQFKLPPAILTNVGKRKSSLYFAAESSGEGSHLEYHGRYSEAEATVGIWTHVALTVEQDGAYSAYVNGVHQITAPGMHHFQKTNNATRMERKGRRTMVFRIGGGDRTPRFVPMMGLVQHFTVWQNMALTHDAVLTLMALADLLYDQVTR